MSKSKKTFKYKTPVKSLDMSIVKYLIIVESPSKCTKIESYLGPEYGCIASNGHIRQTGGLKSIDTKNNYEPMFSIIDEKKDHVEYMRKIIAKFSKSNIILAADDDREGEAIAWHICQVFDLPIDTTQRIIFHEITKPAIQEAIKTPTKINMDLVRAQHARQVLDIIVGYKISPFLWKYLYNNKDNSLSAGRCQTPALRLIYDNEKEKNNTTLETKYKTVGQFFSRNISFTLNAEFDQSQNVLDFLEKTKKYNHEMTINAPKETKQSAPKPFNTSRLLQVASNTLHISPKETMLICQKLYQNGLITYMRTESSQYSKPFIEQIRKYIIASHKNEKYLGKLDELENKDNVNPHEAIRVTSIEMSNIPEDGRMQSMYKLIWRNTIESCMADATYNSTKIQITAPLELYYSTTIDVPIFLGWKIINKSTDSVTNPFDEGSQLLYLKSIKNPVPLQSVESTVVIRNKHQHYTEASLINKLEDLGIGRPSTFASIIETIQERGYVKCTDIEGIKQECNEYKLTGSQISINKIEKTFGNEKNKLVIQPVGIVTIEFLLQQFESLFSYEYTKNMETELDKVTINNWSAICKQCATEIKELSKKVTNITKQTYTLQEGYEFMFTQYGPTIKHTIENNETEYLPVKKDMNIDLEKLQNGEYNIEDLLEIGSRCIGKYEDIDVFIKRGKYGIYIEWTSKTNETIKESVNPIKSLKTKQMDLITIEDVTELLEKHNQININSNDTITPILRQLNDTMSIRKGKYGPYVFYKRLDMKAPQFLNIKKYPEYKTFFSSDADKIINWLIDTYKLPK